MDGWLEQGQALRCFIHKEDATIELTGDDKGILLHGLFCSSIRKTPDSPDLIVQRLVDAERDLVEKLRRPTGDELAGQIRHAVTPLFAAIVTR